MLPRIAAARSQAQRERHYPSALVHEMATAGLFRLKLPAKYGGAEVDHLTYYRVIERLARMDASVGWLVAQTANGRQSCAWPRRPTWDTWTDHRVDRNRQPPYGRQRVGDEDQRHEPP